MATGISRRSGILIFIIAWSSIFVWMGFNLRLFQSIAHVRILFLLLACASVAPIFFYYRIAKRYPQMTLGLVVLSGGLCLIALCIVCNYILKIDNGWTDEIFTLSEILLTAASVIFVWQAAKGSKPEHGGSRSK